MKYEHRYLFVEILEGVLLVMLGVATMLRTEQVLDSLTLIFGILAVITGLADVMFYIRLERHTGFRPAVSLVSSILSIMLGCALIAHPNIPDIHNRPLHRPLNPPEHRAIRGRRGELLAHSHIKRGGIDTGRNSAV